MNPPSPTSPALPRSLLGRVLRWIALAVALIVTLLALWLAAENVTGRIRLARWDQEMRAKGEKPTLADLNLPPAGPKEQRRCPLIEAIGAMKALDDSCKLAASGLPLQKFAAPGKVVVLVRQPEPVDPLARAGDSKVMKEPHAWADLAAQVDRAAAPLENLRVETTKGRWDANLDFTRGVAMLFPNLGPARGAARWLSAAAIRDLHEGRKDAAIENVAAIANLGNAMREEPILISQLVRIAVDSIGMGATWQALQAGGWSDAQLQVLQKTWDREGALEGLSRTFEGERALARVTIVATRAARNPAMDLFTLCDGQAPTFWRRMGAWCVGQAWRWGLSWNDELAYARVMQIYVEAGKGVAREGTWSHLKGPLAEMEARFEKRSWVRRVREPLGGMLVPAFSRATLSFVRHEVQREMTLAAIALERFKLKSKAYPSDLAELVPEFLEAPPRDFMDGQPLRYRKNADGTFTLWSVGENLVDDGGNARPIRDGQKQLSNMWEARDFVWPQPATEEEIRAASSKR